MDNIYAMIMEKFTVFFLVLVRMSSLFVITPVFGRRSVPNYFKIGLAFFCTVILVPLLGDVKVEYSNIYAYGGIVLKELLIGIVMGYVSFLVFSAIYVAGQIIDMQIGFGMVNILDPMTETQVPLMGNFLYILSTMFFLVIDGHYILLQALFKSYNLIPVDMAAFDNYMVSNIIKIFVETFEIGFKISIPILAASLLAEVSLGILAKTVPQMNVFVVGMPLKIGLGLLTMVIVMPVFMDAMKVTFDLMYDYLYLIIRNMASFSILLFKG
ncbi:MAG: flagellar biosynthetic protein FliR [Bacillota bacterium]